MLEKIKGIWENIDQAVIFGTAFGVAATVSFIIYCHLKSKTAEVKHISPPPELLRSSLHKVSEAQNPEKALIRVINSIKKVMPDRESITFQVMKAIYEGQFELSRFESQYLIRQNRCERRVAVNDLRDYLEHVSSYEQSLEQIHNNHLNAILAYFRIDKSSWMDLVEEVSNQNKEEWDLVLVETEEKELDCLRLKDKASLKLSKLKEILQFKAGKLADRMQEFKETFKLVEPSTLFVVTGLWADDVVYQKFKVEAQDINSSIRQLTPEERAQLKQNEKKVSDLIESLVLGNDVIQF